MIRKNKSGIGMKAKKKGYNDKKKKDKKEAVATINSQVLDSLPAMIHTSDEPMHNSEVHADDMLRHTIVADTTSL